MDIEQFMLNLIIGILGGIISGIIVSRVFMIYSDYRDNLKDIERYMEPILSAYVVTGICREKGDFNEEHGTKMIKDYLTNNESVMRYYDPKKFKGVLKKLTIDIYDVYQNINNFKMDKDMQEKLKNITDCYFECERNKVTNVTSIVIKDIVIEITGLICMILLIATTLLILI